MKQKPDFLVYAGIFTIVFFVVANCAGFGGSWTLNKYGLPVPYLSDNGMTYHDGSYVDGITRGLINSGMVETYDVVMLTSIAGGIGLCVWMSRTNKRK